MSTFPSQLQGHDDSGGEADLQVDVEHDVVDVDVWNSAGMSVMWKE